MNNLRWFHNLSETATWIHPLFQEDDTDTNHHFEPFWSDPLRQQHQTPTLKKRKRVSLASDVPHKPKLSHYERDTAPNTA
jgi:hypothetical protein